MNTASANPNAIAILRAALRRMKWSLDGAIDHVVAHDEVQFAEAWHWLLEHNGRDTSALVRHFDQMSPEKATTELSKLLGTASVMPNSFRPELPYSLAA